MLSDSESEFFNGHGCSNIIGHVHIGQRTHADSRLREQRPGMYRNFG